MSFAKKFITFLCAFSICFCSWAGLPEKLNYAKIRSEIKNSNKGQWITVFGSFTTLTRLRAPNDFGGEDRNFESIDVVGFLTTVADLCETKTVKIVRGTSGRIEADCVAK